MTSARLTKEQVHAHVIRVAQARSGGGGYDALEKRHAGRLVDDRECERVIGREVDPEGWGASSHEYASGRRRGYRALLGHGDIRLLNDVLEFEERIVGDSAEGAELERPRETQ